MTMPISIRDEATSDLAGNQFVPACASRFRSPSTTRSSRCSIMHELVIEQRAEPALAMVDPLARILNRLPTSVSTGIFGSMLRGVDFVTSNVPGAPFPIYTAGARSRRCSRSGR